MQFQYKMFASILEILLVHSKKKCIIKGCIIAAEIQFFYEKIKNRMILKILAGRWGSRLISDWLITIT